MGKPITCSRDVTLYLASATRHHFYDICRNAILRGNSTSSTAVEIFKSRYISVHLLAPILKFFIMIFRCFAFVICDLGRAARTIGLNTSTSPCHVFLFTIYLWQSYVAEHVKSTLLTRRSRSYGWYHSRSTSSSCIEQSESDFNSKSCLASERYILLGPMLLDLDRTVRSR